MKKTSFETFLQICKENIQDQLDHGATLDSLDRHDVIVYNSDCFDILQEIFYSKDDSLLTFDNFLLEYGYTIGGKDGLTFEDAVLQYANAAVFEKALTFFSINK